MSKDVDGRRTLREDVHRVVDLDVHVVTDGLQLLALGRNKPPILAPDLVRGRAILGEATGYDNALPVLLRLVRFLSLVLQLDGDLRNTASMIGSVEQCKSG